MSARNTATPQGVAAEARRQAAAKTTVPPTVSYRGHSYRLLWTGPTRFGARAKLGFMDGSKEFWADASAIGAVSTPVKRTPVGRVECDECGEFVYHGTKCWETGFLH